MFNKIASMLDRIRSLEEVLGVRFSPKDTEDGYNEHLESGYGLSQDVKQLKERLTELENKSQYGKTKNN